MIADGLDPIHATYVFIHHIASIFAENVSQLPEMETFTKEFRKAEVEYLPSGPPMSPLTRSYFTSWAFFDLRIGTTTDTLASCLIDANDIIWMNPDQLSALKNWSDEELLEWVRISCLPSPSRGRHLPNGHPRSEVHAAPCMRPTRC